MTSKFRAAKRPGASTKIFSLRHANSPSWDGLKRIAEGSRMSINSLLLKIIDEYVAKAEKP